MASTFTDSKTTADGFNTTIKTFVAVYGDTSYFNLPNIGLGKTAIVEVQKKAYGTYGYPNMYTPTGSGYYFVWVQSSSNYYINSKDSVQKPAWIFLGMYSSNTNIFSINGSFWVMYTHVDD